MLAYESIFGDGEFKNCDYWPRENIEWMRLRLKFAMNRVEPFSWPIATEADIKCKVAESIPQTVVQPYLLQSNKT